MAESQTQDDVDDKNKGPVDAREAKFQGDAVDLRAGCDGVIDAAG